MKKTFIFQWVALTLVIFLFQGCSGTVKNTTEARETERELVHRTIESPERAMRFISLLDQRDQLINNQIEAVNHYRQQMKNLNIDYTADRKSFEKAVAAFNKNRVQQQRLWVELIVAMKKETTAKEWKKITKFQLKHLNARELSYQQTVEGV